jgi:hypothetical protein
VYTVVNSDFRYFQTRRLEDVTHDMDVQKKSIIQIIMEAQFVDQNARIEGEEVKLPPENWNIRVSFNILQKSLWDTRADKISLRVKAEDRKWASDYIDKFENLIYNIPRGNRTPTVIFWLFVVPLFFLLKAYVAQLNTPADWFIADAGRYAFYSIAALCALMTFVGVMVDFFGFRPYAYRILFGADSGFVWGQGREEHEALEHARQIAMWTVGAGFIFLLLVSLRYAI